MALPHINILSHNGLRPPKEQCTSCSGWFIMEFIGFFFQIDTQLQFFLNFWQNGCRRPFWMSENHFRSHFWPFLIKFYFWIFLQNGCRRPFWMSENHFRSHFWPFQINTKLLEFFFTKWPPAPITDVQNSLLIAFLAISDRYSTLFFWRFLTK